MVLVPTSNGIPAAAHCSFPIASPARPFAACHVTRLIPFPPPAVPVTFSVEAEVVITDPAGEPIRIATGLTPLEEPVTAGNRRVTKTVLLAECRAASKA